MQVQIGSDHSKSDYGSRKENKAGKSIEDQGRRTEARERVNMKGKKR